MPDNTTYGVGNIHDEEEKIIWQLEFGDRRLVMKVCIW